MADRLLLGSVGAGSGCSLSTSLILIQTGTLAVLSGRALRAGTMTSDWMGLSEPCPVITHVIRRAYKLTFVTCESGIIVCRGPVSSQKLEMEQINTAGAWDFSDQRWQMQCSGFYHNRYAAWVISKQLHEVLVQNSNNTYILCYKSILFIQSNITPPTASRAPR